MWCKRAAGMAYGGLVLALITGLDSVAWAMHLSRSQHAMAHILASSSPQFVYVINSNRRFVSEYRTGRGGALIPIGTVATQGMTADVRVDPVGPYAYVLNDRHWLSAYSQIAEYTLGAQGRLHAIGTVAIDTDCWDIVIGPKGKHVYGADDNGGLLEYAIGSHGALHQTETMRDEQGISVIAINATGRYLFGVNNNDPMARTHAIYEYAIGRHGALTALGSFGSYDAAGSRLYVVADPAGPYLYVASIVWRNRRYRWEISEYQVERGGGLRVIGAVPGVVQCMTVNNTGKYVYVCGYGDIRKYAIGLHGKLKEIGKPQPGPEDATAIVAGRGGHAYVANGGVDTVSVYRTGRQGGLEAVGALAVSGADANLVPDSARGRFAYVVQHSGLPPTITSRILTYTVGSQGRFKRHGTAIASASPYPLAVSSNGRYALQVSKSETRILEYALGPRGRITSMGATTIPTYAISHVIVVDPAGPYFFVHDESGVTEYALAPGGRLTRIGVIPKRYPSEMLAVGPRGRHLYITVMTAIYEYDIGPGGVLTKLGVVRAIASRIIDLAFGTPGRYAYTLSFYDTGHNRDPFKYLVTTYAITPKVGLVSVGQTNIKGLVNTMVTDPSGPYLYIAKVGGYIAEYTMAADGRLKFGGSVRRSLYDPRYICLDVQRKVLYTAQWESLGVDGERTVYFMYGIRPHGRLVMVGAVKTGRGWGPVSMAMAH